MATLAEGRNGDFGVHRSRRCASLCRPTEDSRSSINLLIGVRDICFLPQLIRRPLPKAHTPNANASSSSSYSPIPFHLQQPQYPAPYAVVTPPDPSVYPAPAPIAGVCLGMNHGSIYQNYDRNIGKTRQMNGA
ncbi:hypothetical protein ACFX11_003043 [Malus domestica]